MKKIYIVSLVIIIGILIVPNFVFGADSFDLGGAGTELGLETAADGLSIRQIVINIVKWLIGFIGIAAIVMILYGGVRWMTAGGSADQVVKAKKIIINAAIGLIICIVAFAIVSFIQTQVVGWIGDGTGDGNEDDGGTTSVSFIISDWDPETGATDLPRNITIGIDFNQDIDQESVDFTKITILTTIPGNNIDVITLTDDDINISNRRIEILAPLGCDWPDIDRCYDASAIINISVGADLVLSADDDEPINCTQSEYHCAITFTVGELFDTTLPTVFMTNPINNSSYVDGDPILFSASAQDDFAINTVEFYAADELVYSATYNQDSDLWNLDWTLTGFDNGDHIYLKAKATDSSNNESYSSPVRITQRPAHCFDDLQNQDETGIDCGGDDCGACEGESCDANPDTESCDPNNNCASGLYCDADACICEALPVITNISPDNGAIGNLVTITGTNFGDSEGSVFFIGNVPFGIEAVLAGCDDAWSDTQVIVEVPTGFDVAEELRIALQTAGGLTDDTINDSGYHGTFTVNDTLRPGICSINAPEGLAFSDITVIGAQFGDGINENDLLEIGGFTAPIDDSGWTDVQIAALIPNLQPGTVGVRVLVDGEYSNVVNLTINADDINPIIAYLEPSSGPVGQYVTIYGDNFGYDENVIGITFDGFPADIEFPPLCGEWSIDNNEILVKVPTAVQLGVNDESRGVDVVVTRDGYDSNPANFIVNNNPLQPGLCLLNPNHGLPSTEVNIYGEGFGSSNGTVYFYNNQATTDGTWSNTQISNVTVPGSTITGPVQVESSLGVTSGNTLNFTIDLCTESNTPVGYDCCLDGQIAPTGECGDGSTPPPEGEYTWNFTTGVPFTVTNWTPSCGSACLNAAIQVDFSHQIADVSINDSCAEIINLTDDSILTSTITDGGDSLQINHDNFAINTQYRVIVHTGEYDGVDCILSDQDNWPFINPNFDTNDDQIADSFSWIFATSAEECVIDRVEVNPTETTFYYEDDSIVLTGIPYGPSDSCEAEGQMLNIADFTWTWNSTSSSLTLAGGGLDNQEQVRPNLIEADYGLLIKDNQLVTVTAQDSDSNTATNQASIDINIDIPIITDIDPTQVVIEPGVITHVTITGHNFGSEQSSSYVMVGNYEATIADCDGAWSDDSIVIELPQETSTDDTIKVFKERGDDESAGALTVLPEGSVQNLKPILCSITPNYGTANTTVSLSGYNFGDTQVASQVKVNDDGTMRQLSNYQWSNTSITGNMPLLLSISNIDALVSVNIREDENGDGDYSDDDDLDADSLTQTFSRAPYIDHISPDNGPEGQYVTIYGRNFGSVPGVVKLNDDFMSNTQNHCTVTWSNNMIIKKVPTGLAPGDYDLMVITAGAPGIASDNTVLFSLNDNPLGANLCGLDHAARFAGETITMMGDNIGTDSSMIRTAVADIDFIDTNNMSVTNISISGPVTEAVNSGPVYIIKSVVVRQECLGFHIGNWCPFGYTDITEDVYSNSLPFVKLNTIEDTLFSIEDNACDDSGFQSPSPYPSQPDVCLQTAAVFTFNKSINLSTVDVSGTDRNVWVDKCIDETCSTHTSVALDEDPYTINAGKSFYLDLIDLEETKTYLVHIGGGILSTDGSSLTGVPFEYTFETGSDDCGVDGITVLPATMTVEVDDSGQLNANTTTNSCLFFDDPSDTWSWSDSPINIASISSSTSSQVTVTGVNEGITDITASIVGLDDITGSSTVTVSPGNITTTSDDLCGNDDLDAGEQCDFDSSDNIIWSDSSITCTDIGLFQDGTLSCDSSDCSYDTSMCLYTTSGNDLCRNTETSITFGDYMNSASFDYTTSIELDGDWITGTVRLEKRLEPGFAGGCTPTNGYVDGYDDGTYTWCTIQVDPPLFEIVGPNPTDFRKLYLLPDTDQNLYDEGSYYQVVLRGGDDGIQSSTGNTLPADFVWSFDIGSDLCPINHVNINPSSYQFTDQTAKPFMATVYDEQNRPLFGSWLNFDWTEETMPDELDRLSIVGSLNSVSSVTPFTDALSGYTYLQVETTSDLDSSSATDQSRIDLILCDHYIEFDYTSYNIKTGYCQDNASGGDLLPIITSTPGATSSDVALNILYTSTSSDAIGLKIMYNYDHLAPQYWYQENIDNQGSPNITTHAGYSAIQEGRTTYINATNKLGDFIYTNIYILSYTQDASPETINIYNQILNNLEFNTNITDLDQKIALITDTKRVEDMFYLKSLINDYDGLHHSFPKLSSGSYNKFNSISTWDSWQNALGAELGTTLPVDPMNEHIGCDGTTYAGYDPITCWNPTSEIYSCPLGSRVYRYEYTNDGATEEYNLYMSFDLLDVTWSGEDTTNTLIIGSTNFCTDVSDGGTGPVEEDSVCGDGNLDPGEQCDDGDNDNNDGCSAACLIEVAPPTCPDNILHLNEDCDPGYSGNTVLSGGLLFNGLVINAANEEAKYTCLNPTGDDYLSTYCQSCNAICINPTPNPDAVNCYDGTYDLSNEICDYNDPANTGLANWSCSAGASISCSDGCLPVCSDDSDPYYGVCGNTYVEPPEDCDYNGSQVYDCDTDDGYLGYYNCTNECLLTEECYPGGFCGDGSVQSGFNGPEECDWDGYGPILPSESGVSDQYQCDIDCLFTDGYCGDGVIDSSRGEFCDPGSFVVPDPADSNVDNQYGCGAPPSTDACQYTGGFCDDGIVQVGPGEFCDDDVNNFGDEFTPDSNVCGEFCDWTCDDYDSLNSLDSDVVFTNEPVGTQIVTIATDDAGYAAINLTFPACRVGSTSNITMEIQGPPPVIDENSGTVGVVIISDLSGSMSVELPDLKTAVNSLLVNLATLNTYVHLISYRLEVVGQYPATPPFEQLTPTNLPDYQDVVNAYFTVADSGTDHRPAFQAVGDVATNFDLFDDFVTFSGIDFDHKVVVFMSDGEGINDARDEAAYLKDDLNIDIFSVLLSTNNNFAMRAYMNDMSSSSCSGDMTVMSNYHFYYIADGICSDGVINCTNFYIQYEECDDGNTTNGDTCSSVCQWTNTDLKRSYYTTNSSGLSGLYGAIGTTISNMFNTVDITISSINQEVSIDNTGYGLLSINTTDLCQTGFENSYNYNLVLQLDQTVAVDLTLSNPTYDFCRANNDVVPLVVPSCVELGNCESDPRTKVQELIIH